MTTYPQPFEFHGTGIRTPALPPEAATPTYRDRAACRPEVARLVDVGWPAQEAHELWFPPGDNYLPQHVEHAKAVCNGGTIPDGGRPADVRGPCPVKAKYLAKNLYVKHGVFGGLTPAERDSVVRRLRRQKARV